MNRPRSGIAPPEVTASRCAPGRAVSVPASRSYTSRGRSSANSVDGYLPDSRSSVASNALRGSVANGALRRTASNQRSASSGSSAHAATVCWASTSSGFVGTRMVSISPDSIRRTVTAQPIRSVRCFGNSTPWEISPT